MKRRNMIGMLAGAAGVASGNILINSSVSFAKETSSPVIPDKAGDPASQYPPSIIFASQTQAMLDSNVITGGGTDDTEVIQSILDKAPELGNLHLVMDGAALISGLNIHSNTTIECLNTSCGFFLAPGQNRSVIQNANLNMHGDKKDKNITLLGGTYNHNCEYQDHHTILADNSQKLVIAMEFYGIDNLTLRDVTIRNQRTYALLMANWYRVNMENIYIDLDEDLLSGHKDGIHFYGPGQFLNMRNIQGSAGDDFIALACDEHDLVSSITDVIIDGVLLNNSEQGIRLLSRGTGRLDRIFIRNITGTYRRFGFYIDPWKKGASGNFGNIIFENINLQHIGASQTYTTPFLFRVSGKIESLTLRNIYHHQPPDNRSILEIGWPHEDDFHTATVSCIDSLLIDGLNVYHPHDKIKESSLIKVSVHVNNLNLQNVRILKPDHSPKHVCLIETRRDGKINSLYLNNIQANCMQTLLLHKTGKIGKVQLHNIFLSDTDNALIKLEGGVIGQLITGEVYGSQIVSSDKKEKAGKMSGRKN